MPIWDFRRASTSKPACTREENAAELLQAELGSRGYTPSVIALGANTDPYQPIERKLRITRGILEVLERFNHPVAITTKSGVVTRDIDILQRMAARNLVRVHMLRHIAQ
ncbi:hypothetical protein ACU4HD_14695 [Cupriavidus basilensis]